jgi:acyl-CoA synthetase (AMP-forming)/AMP-acid ligase II
MSALYPAKEFLGNLLVHHRVMLHAAQRRRPAAIRVPAGPRYRWRSVFGCSASARASPRSPRTACPDDEWGQRLCAAVVGAVTEDRLRAYAREHLPPARRPKTYRLVAELPRTSTGKVRRIDLNRCFD